MFEWLTATKTPHEKLIEVIKAGDAAEAQKLIAAMDMTELSKVDNYGITALTLAAHGGLDKVCELLIPKITDQAINHVTKAGNTALTWPAEKGLDKVCELLIPKMSQQAINHVTKDGNTALIFAAEKGLDKVCKLLINKMSEQTINQINNNGNTALILATKNGFKNICDLLQKTDNYEKLIEAIKTKNTTEAQKLIAKMDITELSKVDKEGETALTLAAEKGLDKVCEMLIPKMSPQAINQINNNANTALTLAAWKGLDKVCEMLINKMSQLAINHVNKNGETALTWATYKGLDKVCELLIPKMSQQAINQINNNGWTALSLATKNGFKNICDLLQKTDNYEKLIEAIKTKNTTEAQKLIAKMDILELSKVDNGGETALTLAAYKGLDKVCELLIPKMSNEAINQINNYGNTALILATKNGFKNICDLLTNKEEQQQAYNQQLILAIEENKIEEAKNLIFLINSKYLNNVDNNNNTALHYTVDKSLTELSMVLIQKMSKEAISIRNIYNNTALHYATDNGLEEVSWFLINKMTQEALDMVNIYGNTALDYAIYNKLIITGFLAKKMSLEVVKTVNANCTGDLANIEYKNIEQYNKTREHEKIIGQCFSLPIKEPSPLSLKEENTSNSEVGLALLAPFSIITTLIVGYFSYLFWNYLRKNSDQKAETFNTQGNIFCGKEEYNKAIEKYKEAIAISKNPLYVTNKTNAEKKYEEQQQSLKLKQTTSIINENKPADIKDLPKEVTKQDLAQENLREKLATFQKIVVETITKLESNTTINEKDKAVLQDRINEIAKTVKTFLNKADIDIITKSMEELASGKITKARIAVVEEDLIEIIEQRVKLEEGMRTEKLAIFEKIIEEMTTKLKGNTTISEKDKDIMQDSINRIVSKVQSLANKTDIETITEIIKELVNGKITKARLGVVEEDIDQLIEQQSKPSHDVIVNKVTMEMLVDLEDKIDETTKIDSLTRIDQLSIFKLVVAKVITNLENDKTITANNKVSMQNSINEIISGVSRLTNVSDIEKITASMKEFTTGGITKDKLIDLEGELDIIIVLQMNEATNEITTWAVTEIIYDKPLLNHPKLLQAAVNSKLAHDLIQEAINNNDEELILAGLISVGYDVTTIG